MTGLDSVTVVIAHIPTRPAELQRAIASVLAQTHKPDAIVVSTDTTRSGSAITRNRGMHHVATNWIAFLDDDDEFLPNHLEVLLAAALESGAGIVYSGCRVVDEAGNEVPRREEWGRFGEPFDADILRQRSYIPVTSLVSKYVANTTSFHTPPGSEYDDWGFYLWALNRGAKFLHVPEVTWIWHHHGANTSGRADRW